MSESATPSTTATDSDDLRGWLVERVAEHLKMPAADIRPDVPLSDYGLDSVYALSVAAEIEDHLGFTVDPTMMWDNPTVDALLTAIGEERARSEAA
ncbi:acyl carrier protein [Streptomyces sp. ICN988]|uniref:acyl carrier protein n=1 Tax=unclassified Streptomyces TaxID=2593676 RepID=UPI0021E3B313|nr:acyl carrier protein [Streptomyces sp. ICN988]MCV2463769.1 acyl carrier protein [Streptomyces sp. ICN988]